MDSELPVPPREALSRFDLLRFIYLVGDPCPSYIPEMDGGFHPTEHLGVDEPLGILAQQTGRCGF